MNFLNNGRLLIDTLQHLLIIIFVKKKSHGNPTLLTDSNADPIG